MAPAFRGRGRLQTVSSSRSQSSSPEPEARIEPNGSLEADIKPIIPPPGSSTASVASLLRKNDYTRKLTPANGSVPKFIPKMIRRQPQELQPKIKEENNARNGFRTTARMRGRGRGRGSLPREASEMIASGTFSQGPAAGVETSTKRSADYARGSGLLDDKGVGGTDSKSGATTDSPKKSKGKAKEQVDAKPLSHDISADDDSGEDDFDDLDYDPQLNLSHKLQTMDMRDIHTEGPSAPLTLPRDRGKIFGVAEAQLFQRDEAQSKLSQAAVAQQADVDMDLDQDSTVRETLADAIKGDSAVLTGDLDLSSGFINEDGSCPELIHILQFPRLFPNFVAAEGTPSALQPRPISTAAIPTPSGPGSSQAVPMEVEDEDKKDVKPQFNDQIDSNIYIPGKWQGFGRNSGRGGRDVTELAYEGRIGKLVVRKSGKVSLVLGRGANKIKYDILPGANASFLQELAIQIPEKLNKPAYTTDSALDAESTIEPGIYVMGQTSRKFIARPNIDQLLRAMDVQKVEKAKQLKVKRELDMDQATDGIEELLGSHPAVPAAAPAVKRPSSKPKAKAKS